MFSRAVKDNTDLSWLGWVEDSMMGEVPRSSWSGDSWGFLCITLVKEILYTGCVLHSQIRIFQQTLL